MLPWIAEPPPDRVSGIRDTSLAKVVRDDLLSRLLHGELAPGQRINEPDVAARLGISRVPVREALRELESSGLVVARKHAGVFVRVLTPKEVADRYELRAALDGLAGLRAAALPDAPRRALVKRLQACQAEMKATAAARDFQAYYLANLAFHWAIVEAADNQALADSYQGVVQQLHLSRLRNLSRDLGVRASLAEHRLIVTALAEGDAARAQALLADHVNAAHQRLDELLAADPG